MQTPLEQLNHRAEPVEATLVGQPVVVADGGNEASHDVMWRRRDAVGDRTGWTYAAAPPFVRPVLSKFAQVPLLFERLNPRFPVRTAALQHHYDDKLVHMHQVLLEVRGAEELAHQAHQAAASSWNSAIDEQVARLREERQTATMDLRASLAGTEQDLSDHHRLAADCFAELGCDYDPASPNAGSLLDVRKMSLSEAAAALGLPDPKVGTSHIGATIAGTLAGLVVGSLIGASILLVAGFVSARRFGESWVFPLVALALGAAIAYLMKQAIQKAWFRYAETSVLQQSGLVRRTALSVASLVSVFIFIIDVVVERQGILRLAQSQNAINSLSAGQHTSSTPEIVYLVMAAVVTFGYVVYCSFEGYFAGRRATVEALASTHMESDYEARLRDRSNDPRLHRALQAVNRVRSLILQRDREAAVLQAADAPFVARLERLDADRRPFPHELTLEQKRRIQDAHDNLIWAQTMFDYEAERLIERLEPLESWWRRLWNRIFSRRRNREDRHRV